jgi:acetaldehyde dehydrogenase (acetylating)
VWRIAADVAVQLPPALAVIYGLAIVVWYELLRRLVTARGAKRRGTRAEMDEFEQWRRRGAELAQGRREGKEQEAAEESEPDLARRYYYIARRTARAERDAAVAAASEAVEQAIERIERRHREIEAAIDHEESERIRWQLEHPIEGD